MRTISSRLTIFSKLFLLPLWIIVFGSIFYVFGVFNSLINNHGYPNVYIIFYIGGIILLWWKAVRLKRVRLDSNALYISNYIREIFIPHDLIKEIVENRYGFFNFHAITIRFSQNTEFGKAIIFMPTMRWISWSKHPIVDELRQLANMHTISPKESDKACGG